MGRLAGLLRAPQPASVSHPLRLAVVLPTLNEERSLPSTLESIALQTRPARRVIVCDGGSTDATFKVAERYQADFWFCPQRGRGNQVAYAVERLDEEIVVVAHADMIFAPTALESIAAVMQSRPECPGGCLGHTFDRRGALRLVEWWDYCRARWTGVAYGDQAQFFRRQAIADAGGFPAQPIMEDVELSRVLSTLGQPVYLNVPVTVSARRFESHGVLRTALTNARLRRAYRRQGAAASTAIHEQYYTATKK